MREGMHLEGWYKDINLTERWDFDTDKVTGNMTLYAKWAAGDPPISDEKDENHCLFCGSSTDGLVCTQCLPLLYVIILLLVAVLLALVVVLYYLIIKNKKKNNAEQSASNNDTKHQN